MIIDLRNSVMGSTGVSFDLLQRSGASDSIQKVGGSFRENAGTYLSSDYAEAGSVSASYPYTNTGTIPITAGISSAGVVVGAQNVAAVSALVGSVGGYPSDDESSVDADAVSVGSLESDSVSEELMAKLKDMAVENAGKEVLQELRDAAVAAITRKEMVETDAQLQLEVARLKQVDIKVRSHEQAHKSAGGPYAGAASFTYTQGPDGLHYAIAGEVSIDASEVTGNPAATIRKMDIVKRAAMAPSDPSPQDMAVAAKAMAIQSAARLELARQQAAENQRNREVSTEKAVARYEKNSSMEEDSVRILEEVS